MKRTIALLLVLSAPAVSTARAQTCGGSISCTSASAYTFANTGTGIGVIGKNTNGTATTPTIGVFGSEVGTIAGSAGVLGTDGGPCSATAIGLANAGVEGGSATGDGVVGYTAVGAAGVAGYNWESAFCTTSPAVAGFLGYKSGASSYGVYSLGNTGATGTKSFVEPHPTDASKEIRFVSLEGPEAGTYFRGTGHTVRGFATIEVPESFRMVTDEQGLTVVVTPTGSLAQVACISKSLDKIVIQASKDVAFDFVVNGVRKAFKDFQPIAENDDFVPEGPDDNRFFALPAESQRRLVATGIYTADGRVDLQKAAEMGWDRRWAQRKTMKEVLALTASPER